MAQQVKRVQEQEQEQGQAARQHGPALGMRFRHAVLRHARAHYEESGWDVIAEEMAPSELAEIIGSAESEAEAIELARVRAGQLDQERRGLSA